MRLTDMQTLIVALCVAAGTILTRFLAFILFPENKKQPAVITYLSSTIPAAMMGLLVVYCLKGVSVFSFPYGIPELIAIAVTIILHLWKRNVLLSIGVSTILYMILVQFVFV